MLSRHKDMIENGKTASYAIIEEDGWQILYSDDTQTTGYEMGHDEAVDYILSQDYPICDARGIPPYFRQKFYSLPLVAIDKEPHNKFDSISFESIEYVFGSAENLGATIYNLDLSNKPQKDLDINGFMKPTTLGELQHHLGEKERTIYCSIEGDDVRDLIFFIPSDWKTDAIMPFSMDYLTVAFYDKNKGTEHTHRRIGHEQALEIIEKKFSHIEPSRKELAISLFFDPSVDKSEAFRDKLQYMEEHQGVLRELYDMQEEASKDNGLKCHSPSVLSFLSQEVEENILMQGGAIDEKNPSVITGLEADGIRGIFDFSTEDVIDVPLLVKKDEFGNFVLKTGNYNFDADKEIMSRLDMLFNKNITSAMKLDTGVSINDSEYPSMKFISGKFLDMEALDYADIEMVESLSIHDEIKEQFEGMYGDNITFYTDAKDPRTIYATIDSNLSIMISYGKSPDLVSTVDIHEIGTRFVDAPKLENLEEFVVEAEASSKSKAKDKDAPSKTKARHPKM